MHARRLVGLLALAIPGVVRADDAPPVVPAAPTAWPATFQTTEVSNDPMPVEKFRATQDFETIDLGEAAPAGVTAPSEPGRVVYGRVGSEAKHATLAVVRGEGDSLVAFVDANGDGKFGEDERSVAPATPATAGPTTRIGTTWKVPAAKGPGTPLLLTFTESWPRWSGVLGAPAAPPAATKPVGALRLELSETVPAGAKAPEGFAAPVRWATGEYQGQAVVVAIAAGADGTLRAAMTTAAKAADLASEKVAVGKPTEMREGRIRTGTRWSFEGLEGGGLRGNLTVVETLRTLTGRFNAATTRRGTAAVGGSQWVLLLVDGDYDGRFDSKRDLWYVGPAGAFKSATYVNMFEANEPFRAAGPPAAAYRLVSVDDKGAAVVAPEPAPGPLAEYLERRAERVNEAHWFPLFRADERFRETHDIDAKRPLATTPPRIHYAADFESAKALAAKEGKPLLVDFEADWCVWCKRLDFYTYPDAEVVDRLAKFTVLKVNVDFDPAKTLTGLGKTYGESWGGLPAVGVFHADGAPVSFSIGTKKPDGKPGPNVTVDHIAGFSTPAELAAQLDSAYAAWKAGARATPTPKLEAPPPPPSTGAPLPVEPHPPGVPVAPGMGAAPAK